MKKCSLILVILILLISCSKTQEKKRIEIKSNNRFRMKTFTPEDIPRFLYLHLHYGRIISEKKDKKIRYDLCNCEDAGEESDGAIYIKNNFIYTTGDFSGRINKTKKFDLIIKNNKVRLLKISEWKQTQQENQIEINFYKHREDKKFLTYFLNITDKKIAKFIPEGVAIRFLKKFDFNRDGKPDYFVLFSYPIEYDDIGLHEETILYIILSHKNGYSLQYKSREGTSRFSFIVDVNVYKNKYLFMSKIGLGRILSTYFELYWYE